MSNTPVGRVEASITLKGKPSADIYANPGYLGPHLGPNQLILALFLDESHPSC